MGQDQGRIFSSWKEIGAFLGKGVRTVQRWEKTHGLPVSRPAGCVSNIVFAKEDELVRWMRNQNVSEVLPLANVSESQLKQLQASLERLEATQSRLEQSLIQTEKRLDEIERMTRGRGQARITDPSLFLSKGGDGPKIAD